MIVKIVGFKVGLDKSTCYYKVRINEDIDWTNPNDVSENSLNDTEIEQKLGHYMRLALEKSDFVSVRQ